MRVFKWFAWGFGVIIALAFIGVLVIVWFVDPNRFKPQIEAAVRKATGRDFTLVGDIELGFFPWLALRTGAGRFGDAPGFGPDPMVTWKSAQLGARVFPLLRGALVVDRVRLNGLDVRLVRRTDGTANWQGIGSSTPADPAQEQRHVTVDGIEVTDGHVLYVDETAPRRIEVTALNLTTDAIDPGQPFTDTEVEGRVHTAGFVAGGVPFRVAVPKVELARDYGSVEVGEYEIEFGGFEAQGKVGGRLGAHPKLGGAIETNEFDLRALLVSVGIEAPKTTDARALGKVGLKASWTFDAGAVGIDPLALTLDDTHFKGSFRRGAGPAPVGEFALRGDELDIARYVPPSDPASEPFVLPTAALKALQFRGSVDLEQAKYEDIEMKGVTLRLLLDAQGLRQAAQ